MNKGYKTLILVAVLCAGTCAFAGPHHRRHHRNEGLELANGIVDLVCRVVNPAPVVVTQPAQVVVTQPAPVVVTQPAPVVVTQPAPVVVTRPVYYTRPMPPPPRRHHPHRGGRHRR